MDEQSTSWSLDEWAEQFHQRHPQLPGLGRAGENWLWFVGYVAAPIAEAVRREEFANGIQLLGQALQWLCCFVGKYKQVVHGEKVWIRNTLSDFVWRKYTGMCYACAFKYTEAEAASNQYLRCVCPAIRVEIETRHEVDIPERSARTRAVREAAWQGSKPKPTTLDGWSEMIRHVYGPAHSDMSLSAICLHFIEEVGEVAKAIQRVEQVAPSSPEWDRSLQELEDELADVFSWIFGLFNKLDQFLAKAKSYYAGVLPPGQRLPELKMSALAQQHLKGQP